MSRARHWGARLTALGVVVLSFLAAAIAYSGAASAHPLGNATVNHYDGLQLRPNTVNILAVEDVAEIPTFQRKDSIDRNGDGTLSTSEMSYYAANRCASIASAERLTVRGRRLPLHVLASSYTQRPGAIHLPAGRLSCDLSAAADLRSPATIAFHDSWDSGGIGWHEITATGTQVSLQDSPFPARSISDALRHYPNDLLTSPLDVTSGTLRVRPGPAPSSYLNEKRLAAAGPFSRAINDVSLKFNDLVGANRLTVGVGIAAIGLSLLLGAGHALLPGHGKTIMAAYLVGRHGRTRDVVAVGATVTLTHTAGVLILGLLVSFSAAFAPTAVEQDLAILSGLLIAGVGVFLLIGALRRGRLSRVHRHDHGHGHVHVHHDHVHHDHGHAVLPAEQETVPVQAVALTPVLVGSAMSATKDHFLHPAPSSVGHDDDEPHVHSAVGHVHSVGHDSPPQHSHGLFRHSDGPHADDVRAARFTRSGLVGLGVAGGLVPSPSALLVLLAAGAMGRTVFGVGLVLSYGVGMALALTSAGLLLVRVRDRIDIAGLSRRHRRAQRALQLLPIATALLVTLVGLTLTLRALHGSL